jgi:hypothetical protein
MLLDGWKLGGGEGRQGRQRRQGGLLSSFRGSLSFFAETAEGAEAAEAANRVLLAFSGPALGPLVVICRLGAYGERRRLVLKRRQQAWAVSCQRTVNLNDEGRRTKDEGRRTKEYGNSVRVN